ncbi:MAG TPA: helix-turn-helix transcriptional regulator [Thermoanaerobaculia bacterium]|nr:helix-turn-helix transcriptional regulator [Thermoanaerobaculia bacterium]
MKEHHEAEGRRLAHILALMVKKAERSHRQLEAELGLASAFLSKILRGKVRLQIAHIAGICEALGVPPSHFFDLAYPSTGQPMGLLMEEVRLNLGLPKKAETPDLEETIKRILRKLLEEKA